MGDGLKMIQGWSVNPGPRPNSPAHSLFIPFQLVRRPPRRKKSCAPDNSEEANFPGVNNVIGVGRTRHQASVDEARLAQSK